MLISPLRLHHDLTSLLTSKGGPHTALLILPQGRLLASSTKYDELYNDDEDVPDVGELAIEDEPYLDEPERIRLLCGLASQWNEDESPRVECEVSSPRFKLMVAWETFDCPYTPSHGRRTHYNVSESTSGEGATTKDVCVGSEWDKGDGVE